MWRKKVFVRATPPPPILRHTKRNFSPQNVKKEKKNELLFIERHLQIDVRNILFIFTVSLQFEAPVWILINSKQESRWGNCLLFWGVLYKHFRTRLMQAMLKRRIDVWSDSLMSGMLFINNLGHERARERDSRTWSSHSSGSWCWAETGQQTLSFHCVTSTFRHTALHSLLRLAYYSVWACACVTYLFTVGLRGMKRDLHFGPNLTWPHTTRNVGKYISIRAPSL